MEPCVAVCLTHDLLLAFSVLLEISTIIRIASTGPVKDAPSQVKSRSERNRTINIAFFIPSVILQTGYVIVGFIGLFRLNLMLLYIYAGIVSLETVCIIIFIIVAPLSAFMIAFLIIRIAVIVKMYFLINELKKANDQTTEAETPESMSLPLPEVK